MRKPAMPYQILLDNNIYVVAIHDPVREIASLKLIIKIIQNKQIKLIGNKFLLEEMSRYSEAFPSPTALMLLRALIVKMEIVNMEERYIKLCLHSTDSSYPFDIVHIASCLQTDSILVTNDRHFDRLKQEKIIPVWNTKEALDKLV
jgi:predicted nucleic acid-binding protein